MYLTENILKCCTWMSIWEQFNNLRDKKKKKKTKQTLVFELSVSYLFKHWYTMLLDPERPHTACDYLHPSEIIETQSKSVTWLLKTSVTNGSLWRGRGGSTLKIRWLKKKKSFSLRPLESEIKKKKKKSAPDVTISKQWNCHSPSENSPFCPWGEVRSRPPEWIWLLEVCS